MTNVILEFPVVALMQGFVCRIRMLCRSVLGCCNVLEHYVPVQIARRSETEGDPGEIAKYVNYIVG